MSAPPQLSSHLLRRFAPSARRPSMARDRRVQLLLSIFDQAFGGASWHGTPLGGALRGVSLRQALWRPRPGRHNIWGLGLHTAGWENAVRRRPTQDDPGAFPPAGANLPR